MTDNKKGGNLVNRRCRVLMTSPRRMWQNRTEPRIEAGNIHSVFSYFWVLNPVVDAAT